MERSSENVQVEERTSESLANQSEARLVLTCGGPNPNWFGSIFYWVTAVVEAPLAMDFPLIRFQMFSFDGRYWLVCCLHRPSVIGRKAGTSSLLMDILLLSMISYCTRFCQHSNPRVFNWVHVRWNRLVPSSSF